MVTAGPAGQARLDAAYAACVRFARAHYENFPVASWLVPRAIRHDVAAVYAFARAADDFADEGDRSAEERLRLLDGWARRLRAASSGFEAEAGPAAAGEPGEAGEIFLALGATIRARGLSLEPFEQLLSAFRQDVVVARYKTWTDLLDYCRRSANPVGRLVLRIAGYRDARLDRWSDAFCTALQLTNFWQDVRVDADRGRTYLPVEEQRGPRAAGLQGAVLRTREYFREGRPVCDAVRGRLGYELRATWLGGMRILERIERSQFDGSGRRPRLGVGDVPWFVVRFLGWPLMGAWA
jgi:phytoene synthase